jgi:hypothetical protein
MFFIIMYNAFSNVKLSFGSRGTTREEKVRRGRLKSGEETSRKSSEEGWSGRRIGGRVE